MVSFLDLKLVESRRLLELPADRGERQGAVQDNGDPPGFQRQEVTRTRAVTELSKREMRPMGFKGKTVKDG